MCETGKDIYHYGGIINSFTDLLPNDTLKNNNIKNTGYLNQAYL
jgi:hypothetical protein